MNTSSPGQPSEGTIALAVDLPWPWPPQIPFTIKTDFDGGYVETVIGTDARIHAKVMRLTGENESIIFETKTGRMFVGQSARIIVFVIWKEPGDLRITVNGEPRANLQNPVIALADFAPPILSGVPPTIVDFAAKNANAQEGRRKRFLELKPEKGRKEVDIQYLLESLREEADQLKDLLAHIDMGKHAHARGLSARLRVLLQREGQVPLLQITAGAKDMPLILYTDANPNHPTPFEPARSILFNFSAGPAPILDNPIDLDVWLGTTALELGGQKLSHAKVLVDLGNTLGSHLDPNPVPSVIALRSSRAQVGEITTAWLTQYLATVARVVLKLCHDVLNQP